MTPEDASARAPLARGTLDRAAEERGEPGLLDRLRADESTRVIAVHADRSPVSPDGRLEFFGPADEILAA